MVSFSILDLIVISIFLFAVVIIGLLSKVKISTAESFLLNKKEVGLILFILTNVSTWYGGILGIGEFVYNYGILSWVTQGLPYYFFALIFAFYFVPKIKKQNTLTIPEQVKKIYGREAALVSSVLIYILVLPSAYILMIANIISLIFQIKLFPALIIAAFISSIYLFFSGYKSDLYTDVLEFFVMFIGFGIIVYFCFSNYGGLTFLKSKLPANHFTFTGNASITYIIVWFLIALWTFADPGFYQRVNAANNYKIAKYGIIVSIFFWFLFDSLTTLTGMYSRALLEDINPVMSFPLLAESVLSPGFKGIFYSGLLATILSTLNSNLFLSATTFGKDILPEILNKSDDKQIIKYTRIGLIITALLAIILANYFQSVIAIWYTIGSLCIPSLIFPIFSSYFEKYRINQKIVLIELVSGFTASLIWFILKENLFLPHSLLFIEPMIVGLIINSVIHLVGIKASHSRI